jgi:hypothetical protein
MMEIPLEKQFEIAALKAQLDSMNNADLKQLVAVLYEQGIIKDLLMAEFMKAHLSTLNDVVTWVNVNS